MHSNTQQQQLGFNEKDIIPEQVLDLCMFELYYGDKSSLPLSQEICRTFKKIKSAVHKNN